MSEEEKKSAESSSQRQKLELFRELEQAEGKRRLEIYRKLQNLYILEEKWYEKAFVAEESMMQGVNRGLAQTLGLPADLTNLIIGLGETGVRKLLDAAGFEIESGLKDSKLMSKKPFLGSAQVTEIFNNLGIETEYDKTRALTRMIGRIGEEVGMTTPIAGPLATRAAAPLKYLRAEAGITLTAGVGAATAKEMFPGSLGAEITGQLIGGFTPLTLKTLIKYIPGLSYAKESFRLMYNPKQREREIAGNILYQRLGKKNAAKLLEKLEEGDVTILGEKLDKTKFPRTLDQFTQEPELIKLRQQLEQGGPQGMDLIDEINNLKLTRLLQLENLFYKNMKKKDYGIEATVGAVEERANTITNYLDKRLQLAEETAASKIKAINPNMTREQASALLRREIDDALSDALAMEQRMWGRIEGTIDGDTIAAGASAIINNQFKTTDPKNIPKILFELAGEKHLVDAGYLPKKLKTETYGTVRRSVPVEPKKSILGKEESISEIVNLRTRVRDEIRIENSKPMPNAEKIKSLDELLGIIDGSFTDAANPKNINDVTRAIEYSDDLTNSFYKSEVGSILGYDTKGKLKVIPETTFNKLILKGDEGGIATKDVQKILTRDSEGVQEGLKNRFSQLADQDGIVPSEVIEKFILNNEESLNQFPVLKQQFLDANEAANIIAQQRKKYDIINRDIEKFRLETLVAKKGDTLSAKGIVTRIFNSKDPVKDINNIIKLSGRDPSGAALKGLQNEVSDYMFNTIKTRELKGQLVPEIKELNKFIKKNEEALVALYGQEGFDTIKEFQKIVKSVDNAIMKGTPGDLEVIAKNNVFVSSVGRILGTKVASLTGGPALVFAGIGGRIANSFVSKKAGREIHALLGQAFVDPEFAKNLLRPYVDNQQEIVGKAVNAFLVNAFGSQVREAIEPDADIDETGTMAPTPDISFDQPPVAPESRLAEDIFNPVSMRGTATGGMDPQTMARGQQLFNRPGEITFANQGGIMSTNKAFQRVA
jgi:hypothetical protein